MVSRQKIMIVDDDAHIAELISLYLTKECFDTNIVLDVQRRQNPDTERRNRRTDFIR